MGEPLWNRFLGWNRLRGGSVAKVLLGGATARSVSGAYALRRVGV